MKRRDFLKTLPIGVAATGLPFTFRGLRGNAYGRNPVLDTVTNITSESDRVLVLINLAGGNDGLNTVIPFTNSVYQQRTKIGFTSSDDRTRLQDYLLRPDLALNPNMDSATKQTKSMKLWKDGKLAVVQNVGYADPNTPGGRLKASELRNPLGTLLHPLRLPLC